MNMYRTKLKSLSLSLSFRLLSFVCVFFYICCLMFFISVPIFNILMTYQFGQVHGVFPGKFLAIYGVYIADLTSQNGPVGLSFFFLAEILSIWLLSCTSLQLWKYIVFSFFSYCCRFKKYVIVETWNHQVKKMPFCHWDDVRSQRHGDSTMFTAGINCYILEYCAILFICDVVNILCPLYSRHSGSLDSKPLDFSLVSLVYFNRCVPNQVWQFLLNVWQN